MNHGRVVAATLGLFAALVAFAGWRVVPAIEADLESSVLQALAERGIEVASVTADGRTVNVVGGPERPEERLALVAAARSIPGVRRVRSPLDPPGQASWPTDPVRLAQVDRDASVPGGADQGPVRRSGGEPPDLDAPTGPVGSAGSGGGPTSPAAAPRVDLTAPPVGADEEPEEDRASRTGPAAASTPDPASSPGPEHGGDDDVVEAGPGAAEASRPTGCQARLTVLAEGRTLVFARGEATLAEVDRGVLDEIAGVLRGCGEWTLTIVAYVGADEQRGGDAWALADRRAYAVARFLAGRGIDVSRLATMTGSPAFDEVGEPRAELYVTGGV